MCDRLQTQRHLRAVLLLLRPFQSELISILNHADYSFTSVHFKISDMLRRSAAYVHNMAIN